MPVERRASAASFIHVTQVANTFMVSHPCPGPTLVRESKVNEKDILNGYLNRFDEHALSHESSEVALDFCQGVSSLR